MGNKKELRLILLDHKTAVVYFIMPIIVNNKLTQLSTPDILLKLFVFTAVPVNPKSQFWAPALLLQVLHKYNKTSDYLLKKKKERKRREDTLANTLADREVQQRSTGQQPGEIEKHSPQYS